MGGLAYELVGMRGPYFIGAVGLVTVFVLSLTGCPRSRRGSGRRPRLLEHLEVAARPLGDDRALALAQGLQIHQVAAHAQRRRPRPG